MDTTYTAFEGTKLVAQGTLSEVVLKIKKRLSKAAHSEALIFNDLTGGPVDFNFQGTEKDVQKRLSVFVSDKNPKEATGPGRPRLGVVSREVSLFPAHWEWLASQPGGASATLRRLVEESRKKTADQTTVKQALERTHKFMSSVAGDFENFEEALRALYRKNRADFTKLIEKWPADIKAHVIKLLGDAI